MSTGTLGASLWRRKRFVLKWFNVIYLNIPIKEAFNELCVCIRARVCATFTSCRHTSKLFRYNQVAPDVHILPPRSVCLSVCLCLYSPLLDLAGFFSLLIPYTVGRTPWTGDQPMPRPLPTQRTTHTVNAHRHPRLEGDSNPRSQRSSKWRQFMP
jgi:hypothetical protein